MKWLMTLMLLAALGSTGCMQPNDGLVQVGPTNDAAGTHLVQKPVVINAAAEDPKVTAPTAAVAVLGSVGESGVTGTIHFNRVEQGVRVTGEVSGLSPGKHGFHVHQYGDVSDMKQGLSAGGHFNPTQKPHGHRDDQERHAGDFGNIEANAEGMAKIDFTDSMISLAGETSIIGRGLVVHASEDKFTQPSGDAGPRAAVGVIGIAEK